MSEKIERVKTGVPGLDEILHGGIPRRNIVLISGGPGTAGLLPALKGKGSL
jgi:KaiC/GvpD/RAD55 family RecA-like ATPase